MSDTKYIKASQKSPEAFYDRNPTFYAESQRLKRQIADASNACHDWLIENRHLKREGETLYAPDRLITPLLEAERDLADLRDRERERYFAACRENAA